MRLDQRQFRGIVRERLRDLRRFLGQDIGIRVIVGCFEGFILKPEDVEAGFAAVDELLPGLGENVRVPFSPTPAA